MRGAGQRVSMQKEYCYPHARRFTNVKLTVRKVQRYCTTVDACSAVFNGKEVRLLGSPGFACQGELEQSAERRALRSCRNDVMKISHAVREGRYCTAEHGSQGPEGLGHMSSADDLLALNYRW